MNVDSASAPHLRSPARHVGSDLEENPREIESSLARELKVVENDPSSGMSMARYNALESSRDCLLSPLAHDREKQVNCIVLSQLLEWVSTEPKLGRVLENSVRKLIEGRMEPPALVQLLDHLGRLGKNYEEQGLSDVLTPTAVDDLVRRLGMAPDTARTPQGQARFLTLNHHAGVALLRGIVPDVSAGPAEVASTIRRGLQGIQGFPDISLIDNLAQIANVLDRHAGGPDQG